MTSKRKLMLILLAFGVLITMGPGVCDETGNDVPDVGEETLDEMVEDTVDAVEAVVSTTCAVCTAVNGEGSSSCTGVCD